MRNDDDRGGPGGWSRGPDGAETVREAALRAWLDAETGAGADDPAADAALTALFARLPDEAPSAGFAAATLARFRAESAALAPAPVPAPAAAARRAAALLALLSAATLGLSAGAVTLLPRLAVGGAVATFNAFLAAAWEWIAGGIALWGEAAEWSDLLARLVAVPQVGWTLTGAALAALLAFSLLRRILLHDLDEKGPIHVP